MAQNPVPFTVDAAERFGQKPTPFQQRFGLPAVPRPRTPSVFVGTTRDIRGVATDRFEPLDDARLRYTAFTPDESKKFYQLKDALYPNKWGQPSDENFWKDLANASAYAVNNGERITPFEAGLRMLGNRQAAGVVPPTSGGGGKGGGGGGYKGPMRSDTVSESVNLTDPMTARGLVDQALEQSLGRRATSREQERFLKALTAAEEQMPTVTEQTSLSTPMGPGRTSTKQRVRTTGGMNQSVFAEEFARGQEGAGEFQTATVALSAFMDAIKGVG